MYMIWQEQNLDYEYVEQELYIERSRLDTSTIE